ncbi:proline-rich protein [Mycena belliarum]|uniref:Proline-rich protein n=1 Tax=Mycena belliarum TaxID=1033014 RepID=A0AAD6UE94_9AGAR|nr:proline-rich protein [Mycena belliae]
MWTVTAPFDGTADEADELTDKKTKLLKTNKSYWLGRNGQPLVINSKKISRQHGLFVVGDFTEDNVTTPSTRPTLNYTPNKKSAQRKRADEHCEINPGSACELMDGDILVLAAHSHVEIRWVSVCCYQKAARGKSKASLALCASLGIHLTHIPDSSVNYHLTSTYAVTTLHALSLLWGSTFVKSDWLDEVIRLGNLPLNSDPTNGVSLEQNFKLPMTAKYRPTFGADVPPEHKTFNIWESNEGRMHMFHPYRFLCVGEGRREIDSDLRELLSHGGGKVEVFDVTDGTVKWTKALSRGRAKVTQKLVLIARQDACEAAVGKDIWRELVKEANIFGLQFFGPEDILEVVLKTDTSVLDPADIPADRGPTSTLTDFIPNTHPDEASLVPEPEEPEPEKPPQRKLTRRVSSRQASQEPKPVDDEAPPPRRHLTRRAQATGFPVITGLDDPSIILNNLPDTSTVAPLAPVDTSKPRSRLKRRVGVSVPVDPVQVLISNALMVGVEPETGEEPPLKKFKALFEASDPTLSGVESFVQESGAFDEDELISMANLGSQTQSQTQSGSKRSTRSGAGATALRAVQEEEEEESQMPADGSALGSKRKERSFDGDDVEMAGVEQVLGNASGSSVATGPAAKKRAVQTNAVERATSKPASLATGSSNPNDKGLAPTKPIGKKGAAVAAGAATGKPDTDRAFLKAIASTKRGKKTEDDFDRDFNKLKISKSDLRVDETDERPQWELLESFGDETNLRGNFMVIQDLDIFKTDKAPGSRKRATTNDPRWDGKPDFKKFKKQKNIVTAKKTIELIISEENDGGLGPAYWKGGNSPVRSQDDFGFTQKRATQVQGKPSRSKAKSQTMIIDSDEEAESVPKEKGKRSKPPSKAEPPKKRPARGASKVADTPAALFLDSDSDKAADDEPVRGGTLDEDDFDGGETLQSSAETGTRRSTRTVPATRKRKAAVIVDDDSDDGAVFGGFGKKRARR